MRFFTALFCFSFSGIFAQEDYSLLWEISGNGMKQKSYLFGSIHQNDRSLFDFPDSVYFAMNNSSMIVLEADVFSIDELYIPSLSSDVKLEQDSNFYANSSDASSSHYGSEDGMPQFIDAYFQQYAYNSGKEFFPLETIEFQLGLFSEIDYSKIVPMKMLSALRMEDVIETYKKGDIEVMNQQMQQNLAFYEDMYDILIVRRNVGMAKGLDSLLLQKSIFCAVGAGHLGGGTGLIALLRNKGFTLRKIQYSKNESRPYYKTEVLSQKHYTYTNDTIGFEIKLGGKPQLTDSSESEFKLRYIEFGQGNTFDIEVYRLPENYDDNIVFDYLRNGKIRSEKEVDGELVILAYEKQFNAITQVKMIKTGDRLFILKAHGGTKFTASNRATLFFDKLIIK